VQRSDLFGLSQDSGLTEEDEVHCPKSVYFFDTPVDTHDSVLETGGERSSGRVGAVEFDGPSHFLASRPSRAPIAAALLKPRSVAEATASGAAGPRCRPRALLGVGQVQEDRREGAASWLIAGPLLSGCFMRQLLLRTHSRENILLFS
jgi:hypothetical protein